MNYLACTSLTVLFVVTRGSASVWEGDLFPTWRECINDLRDRLGSVVVPIGSLSIGLCRHRAVLFKVILSFYMMAGEGGGEGGFNGLKVRVFLLLLHSHALYMLYLQVLADTIDLPCRIAKGCKYCSREDASSCLVRFGLDRYICFGAHLLFC